MNSGVLYSGAFTVLSLVQEMFVLAGCAAWKASYNLIYLGLICHLLLWPILFALELSAIRPYQQISLAHCCLSSDWSDRPILTYMADLPRPVLCSFACSLAGYSLIALTYSVATRTLLLPEDYDPKNAVEVLVGALA